MEGLDETIAPLVAAMNRVQFIETLSSCGGHPEEAAVREYGYAVANVVFEIDDEAQNAIHWYGILQGVLNARRKRRLEREHAFIFSKKFSLNADGHLTWLWDVKIQASGMTPEECRAGLDEGLAFLSDKFREVAG